MSFQSYCTSFLLYYFCRVYLKNPYLFIALSYYCTRAINVLPIPSPIISNFHVVFDRRPVLNMSAASDVASQSLLTITLNNCATINSFIDNINLTSQNLLTDSRTTMDKNPVTIPRWTTPPPPWTKFPWANNPPPRTKPPTKHHKHKPPRQNHPE